MNNYSVSNLNRFLFFKLPSAYFSGVRVSSITQYEAVAQVKLNWFNKNPFKSVYWAVQGMASELVTGILVMKEIAESGKKISMLVVYQNGEFLKKAKGKITFVCKDGAIIKSAVEKAIRTGEGQTFTMKAEGFNEDFETVSKFEYTWSIKVK